MKFKNHDFLLISNIIVTGILQFIYFNVVGLISIIISLAYYGHILLTKKRKKYFLIIFIAAIITGMVYYFLNPIYKNRSITMASFIPVLLIIVQLVHATTMPNVKRNSFSGVRTPLALKHDNVWVAVNNIGAIVSYMTLFPLYTLIIYQKNSSKLTLSLLIFIGSSLITLGIALLIEKKFRKEFDKKEKRELQNQMKKESGG